MKKIHVIDVRTVASILTEFMFVKNFEDFQRVYNDIYERYGLCADPFTGCPVSPEDYADLNEDYYKQISEERFGYDIYAE